MAQFDIDLKVNTEESDRQIDKTVAKMETDLVKAGDAASQSTSKFTDWLKAAAAGAAFTTVKMLELSSATKPIASALSPAVGQLVGLAKQGEKTKTIFSQVLEVIVMISRVLAVINVGKLILAKSEKIKSAFSNIVDGAGLLGKNLLGAGKQAGEIGVKMASLTKGVGAASVSGGKLLAGFVRMGPHVAAIAATLWVVKKLIDGAFSALARVQRENIFGVGVKDAERLRKILPDVLTLTDATREALKFRQAGFTLAETEQAARLAKTLSALSGETKTVALEMLRAGQISAKVLDAIRLPQALLDEAFTKAKKASHEQLTQMQKSKIVLEVLQKRYGTMGKDVEKAFQANPIHAFMTDIRAAGQDIKKLFTDDLGFAVRVLGKAVKFALNLMTLPLRALIKGTKTVLQFLHVIGKTTKVSGEAGAAADRLKKKLSGLEGGYGKASRKAQLATKTTNEFLAALDAAKASAKTGLADARAGFSGLAGDVSGILGQQVAVQREVTVLAAKYATAVQVGLVGRMKDLILLRKQGALRREEFAAAVKINAAQTALSMKRIEFLKTNRENLALAGKRKSLTENQFRIAEAQVQLTQKARAIGFAEFSIHRQIEATLVRIFDLRMRMQKLGGARRRQAMAQIANLRKQVAESRTLLGSFREISKAQLEQQKNEIIRQKLAAKNSSIATAEERRKALIAEQDALKGANRELLESQGLLTDRLRIQLEHESRLAALLEKRRALTLQIEESRRRVEALNLSGAALAQELKKQESLMAQRDLVDQLTKVQDRQFASQKRNLTLMGMMFKAMREQANNFTQTFGQTLLQSFRDGVQGVGQLIGSTMEQLVAGVDDVGANAGKTVLTMLGNLAMTMGGLFLAEGFAQMWVPPYTGGLAMMGGAALMALGGAIKGMGSLMSSPPSPKQISGGGGGASIPASGKLPGQSTREPGPATVINNYAVSSDLVAIDKRETARRLHKFGKEQRRDGFDPFSEAPMNKRSFG